MSAIDALLGGIDGLTQPAARGRRAQRQAAARTVGRWERSLARREVFSLAVPEAVTLSCLDGALWVTLEADPQDYVVMAGQALRLPGGRQATIQALAPARFGVARGGLG